jgi:transcriptional regulator GlxA family with amidase domain
MHTSLIVVDRFCAADAASAGTHLSLSARVDGRLGRLVVSIERFDETPQPANRRRVRTLRPEQLARVRAAISERLAERVRRADVAALIGMSVCDFSRVFHASAGMTFANYLLHVRLDAAKTLMATTHRSLSDVASASGFGDQSQFSRRFARTVGMTPSAWRTLYAPTS